MSLGISAEWSANGYRIAGGTAPWALAFSLAIAFLYVWLMYAPSRVSTTPMTGLFRRYLAFWVDFILALIATAPILGLIPMFTEWNRTGVFAWNFERTVPQAGDKIVIAITSTLGAIAILAFYAFPLLRNRPTPGSSVAGYQITAASGRPLTLRRAVLRTLLGFVAVAAFFLAPVLDRNRQRGQFWLDKVFETQAVKLG